MSLSTAVLAAARRRRGGAPAAAPRGGGFPGVGFIPELPDARLSVEIAWGANPSGDSDAWSWTDVTTDVRAAPGVAARLGRNDESADANPAELSLTLDNRQARYSLGGRSPNYPNVKRGVPVRVRVDPGTGPRVVLLAFATGWAPGWDSVNGRIPVVTLTASGTLRRLQQGAEQVISPVKRFMLSTSSVVAYWSCEVGKYASTFPPDVGTNPLWWTGTADLASTDRFAGSNPLPTTNGVSGSGGSFRAQIDTYTMSSDHSQSFRSLLVFPTTEPANDVIIWKLWMNGGSIGRFELQYKTGGGLKVLVYDASGTFVSSAQNLSFGLVGGAFLGSLEMYEAGGAVHYGFNLLPVGSTTYTSLPGDPNVAGTLGNVTEIWIDPSATITGIGFGHVAVLNARSATDPVTDVYLQLNGYNGEGVTTSRLGRVCAENGIGLEIYGGTGGDLDPPTFLDSMGPQPIDTVVNILRECEEVERGVLWDGLDAGLAYTSRRRHENAPAALTIAAASAELSPPFAPTDDDQRLRNRWTVTRQGGAEFTVGDATGPLGTGEVGVYSDSKTINVYQDRGARDLADWLVHVGTVEGYRYPVVTIDLRAVPRLAGAVTDLIVGSRIDITGMSTALDTGPPGTVSLTVEGIAHEIGPSSHWLVTLTCSPFEAWRVAELADDTGDTDEGVARLDAGAGDSALDTFAAAGATSLSVATVTTGALWTTTADDFPLWLNVGGEPVRATACSGAASPQTFTVDALAVDRHIGDAVAVWNPPVLGL